MECLFDDDGNECTNALTPTGVKLMAAIDKVIEEDPLWQKVCLFDSPQNQTCASDFSVGGKQSKASPLDIFKFVYGDDLEEIT